MARLWKRSGGRRPPSTRCSRRWRKCIRTSTQSSRPGPYVARTPAKSISTANSSTKMSATFGEIYDCKQRGILRLQLACRPCSPAIGGRTTSPVPRGGLLQMSSVAASCFSSAAANGHGEREAGRPKLTSSFAIRDFAAASVVEDQEILRKPERRAPDTDSSPQFDDVSDARSCRNREANERRRRHEPDLHKNDLHQPFPCDTEFASVHPHLQRQDRYPCNRLAENERALLQMRYPGGGRHDHDRQLQHQESIQYCQFLRPGEHHRITKTLVLRGDRNGKHERHPGPMARHLRPNP